MSSRLSFSTFKTFSCATAILIIQFKKVIVLDGRGYAKFSDALQVHPHRPSFSGVIAVYRYQGFAVEALIAGC